jgi:uncharacterized membrane-anchored protein
MIAVAISVALAEDPAVVPPAVPVDAPLEVVEGPSAAEIEFLTSLKWRTGDIVLRDGLATLHLPPTFRYLDSGDAARVLEQAWGNPPSDPTLGMLFRADGGPLDEAGWGVVIDYDDSGHVADDDATSIDYGEVLSSMQAEAEAANEYRTSQGFPAVHLLGWAESPHYDAASRKIYWARELDFGNADHTLNYDIRVLGRDGVIELSAIASITQFSDVKPGMEEILKFVEFNPGHRYEEFDPSTDRAAAYGLMGLVAGGVIASKTGLLKGLFIGLLASKKLVIAGLVAVAGGAKAWFGRNSENKA